MQRPADLVVEALRLYMGVMLSFLLLSWIVYRFYPTPDRRPFFDRADRLMDLLNYIAKTRHLYHSSAALGAGFPVFSYSPPAAFLWHVLLVFPNHPLLPYFILVAIALGAFTVIGIATFSHKGQVGRTAMAAFGATIVFGWPLWFALDRGNLEGLMWAVSGAGICFFLRKRYWAAAVCIGLAGCIKPFPFVFCFLLLFRRKFKEAALAAGTTAALILAAYILIGPNPWKAYQDLKPGVTLYTRTYIQTIRPVGEIRFSHSILDELKLATLVAQTRSLHPLRVTQQIYGSQGSPAVRLLANVYPWIAISVLATLIIAVRKAPALNQVTIIALAATLLPPNSGEYTLLNLYVPFWAFLVLLVREVATGSVYLNRRTLLALAIIFGTLFAPLTFLRVYAGAAKLILLLLLAWIVIHTPMPSAYFGDSAEPDQAEV